MILEISGVQVKFPFEPYPLQKDYMEKVIEALNSKQNAVLESPTGTGKTLCLLTSTLSWLIKMKAEKIANYKENFQAQSKAVAKKFDMAFPMNEDFLNEQAGKWEGQYKVVYTSRTHSQLAQAMKELKVTEYAHLKGVALGSRDQLCINEDVIKTATTGAEKIHLCRAKVKAKQCSYHGRVEKAIESPQVANQTVMDIEDLVKTGKACNACPYYMSKTLSGEADIVFLPYNYVLDPRLLKSFALKLTNAVVILDEGHNVEKVCQDAASVQLASSDIATALEDITHIMKMMDENERVRVIPTGEDSAPDFTIEDCAKLKEMVLKLEEKIDSIQGVTSKGLAQPGGKIFDILYAANITQDNYTLIGQLINMFLDFLSSTGEGKVFSRKGAGLTKLDDFLTTVYGSMTKDVVLWKSTVERGYRVFLELEEPKKKFNGKANDTWLSSSMIQPTLNNKAKVVNFWCFNPGFGMANLTGRGVHSIILTSGTLTPLQPLISELALDANHRLENPHVIKPSQVMARIISKGPDGTPLLANYENRENPKFVNSMSLTIKSIASMTPNGLLVFFPSYTLMNTMQQMWQQSGMWQAINEVKPIYTEPRNKEEFDQCMEEYYASVKTSRGAIFMAVLRGKVSEGLDFKDQNGRAVIIIGLPFPPYFDPHVTLKQEYLKMNRNPQNKLQTGQDWYNMEATRAVNQAIGRVIRHKDDYGAIFLCDQRFHKYKDGLSKWIQCYIPKNVEPFRFGPIIKELGLFFRSASSTLPPPVEIKYETSDDCIVVEDRLTAKGKSESLMKRQIKIENSNEIYGNSSSSQTASDFSKIEKFIKKEEKPVTFLSGLNKEVSTIDFNSMDYSASFPKRPLQISPQHSNESDCKRKKFKMLPNVDQGPVNFVMVVQPVKVKRQDFEKVIPTDRAAFLQTIKGAIDNHSHYKFLLNSIKEYNENKNFNNFWNCLMPMFKFYIEHVSIFRGLKRFLNEQHKPLFDEGIEKHFLVE